jgi:metallo-beta-lactamase class B
LVLAANIPLLWELECGTGLSRRGHTVDNIVAWIEGRKVLFSGWLVKSVNAGNLGNTSEADLVSYPVTLKKVKEKYSSARIVVPGHGRPGGIDLITHTIALCNNN